MGAKAVRIAAILWVLVSTALVQGLVAQTATPQRQRGDSIQTAEQARDPQFAPRRNQEDPIETRMERQRLKAWNKERFDDLKKDTDELLKLATELKNSVDRANKDMLSLEVVKKTEEVEKLAKRVREKMKATQ